MWTSLSLARGGEYEGGTGEHTAEAGRGWITDDPVSESIHFPLQAMRGHKRIIAG